MQITTLLISLEVEGINDLMYVESKKKRRNTSGGLQSGFFCLKLHKLSHIFGGIRKSAWQILQFYYQRRARFALPLQLFPALTTFNSLYSASSFAYKVVNSNNQQDQTIVIRLMLKSFTSCVRNTNLNENTVEKKCARTSYVSSWLTLFVICCSIFLHICQKAKVFSQICCLISIISLY